MSAFLFLPIWAVSVPRGGAGDTAGGKGLLAAASRGSGRRRGGRWAGGPPREPPIALAVSISGQQTRLELSSKVDNILVPNLRAVDNVVGCFLVLAQSDNMVNGAQSGNGTAAQALVDGPHFNATEEQVEAFIRGRVEAALPRRAKAEAPRLQTRVRVLRTAPPAYWGDPLWAKVYDKGFDLRGQIGRQQMHLDQWDHLRQTWKMIDASERRCDGGLRDAQVPCHTWGPATSPWPPSRHI